MRFGGYSGWLLTIGQDQFPVRGWEDASPLLQSNWGTTGPELDLTRYEGDVLNAVVNERNEAVVTYLPDESAPEVFSGSYDPNAEWRSFPRSDGYDFEVPASTVISRELALQIIRSYLSTGKPIGLPGIVS